MMRTTLEVCMSPHPFTLCILLTLSLGRRVLAHAFSDKALMGQEPLVQRYVDQLIDRLKEVTSANDEPVDMVKWYNWTTFDVIADLLFGMISLTGTCPLDNSFLMHCRGALWLPPRPLNPPIRRPPLSIPQVPPDDLHPRLLPVASLPRQPHSR